MQVGIGKNCDSKIAILDQYLATGSMTAGVHGENSSDG